MGSGSFLFDKCIFKDVYANAYTIKFVETPLLKKGL